MKESSVMRVLIFLFSASVILVEVASKLRKIEPLVSGGLTPKIEMYPHSVYLLANCREKWHCGASILNERILLTAGQCVYGCEGKWNMRGYMGHEVLDKMTIVRKVLKYKMHRKYDNRNFLNDIALVYLKSDVPFGPNVKRVIIWEKDMRPSVALIAGWGSIDQYEEIPSNRLKSVKQTLRSQGYCNGVYKGLDKGVSIDGMFCTQDINDNRPTFGDAGYALMANNWTQIGIVSFKTTLRNDFIVYTNVTYYRNWIETKSKSLHCHGKSVQ